MASELYWFPAYTAEWLGSAAISMMLPEQEGAYWRLLNLAWGNGASEPSLPADDAALAQMSRLGARWRKLGVLVRAQFEERDGRLYNAKLSAVWLEQSAKHQRAVERASAGGKAKARNKSATSRTQAPPQDSLHGADLELDTETTQQHSASGDAKPTGWPARFAAVWSAAVGPMSAGRMGKAAKPLVDKHGPDRVERAMKAFIAVRKAEGKPCKVNWFVDEGEVWLERTAQPLGVVDGEMSASLELLTRPGAA